MELDPQQIIFLQHIKQGLSQYKAFLQVFPENENKNKSTITSKASQYNAKIDKSLKDSFLKPNGLSQEELTKIFEDIANNPDTQVRERVAAGKAVMTMKGFDKDKANLDVQKDLITELNLERTEFALPNKNR